MINHGLERPRLTELKGLHLPTKGNLASHSWVGTENICGNTTQRLLVETDVEVTLGQGPHSGKHRCTRELREFPSIFTYPRIGPKTCQGSAEA